MHVCTCCRSLTATRVTAICSMNCAHHSKRAWRMSYKFAKRHCRQHAHFQACGLYHSGIVIILSACNQLLGHDIPFNNRGRRKARVVLDSYNANCAAQCQAHVNPIDLDDVSSARTKSKVASRFQMNLSWHERTNQNREFILLLNTIIMILINIVVN